MFFFNGLAGKLFLIGGQILFLCFPKKEVKNTNFQQYFRYILVNFYCFYQNLSKVQKVLTFLSLNPGSGYRLTCPSQILC